MIPRVNIFTNLPQRDKHKDERLAEELRELGYAVWVTDFLPANRPQTLFYKPHIVVLPEARCEYTIDFARQCREWGIRTVVRRCEPGAADGAWEHMCKDEQETVIGAWDYGDAIDLELVWADSFKKLMIEHGYLPEEKIKVCGAFSFDAYLNEKRNFVERPTNKPHILFMPGWGHADRSSEYNIPEAPPGSSLHKDAWKRHNYGRGKWIGMIRQVAKALGEGAQYWISCKTGEIPLAYQTTIGKYAQILQPCPSPMLLENADLVIHPGSTIAIGCHIWNMPAFSFYGDVNQVEGYNYPHVSPNFEDVDELIKAIKAVKFRVEHNEKNQIRFVSESNANVESIKKLEKVFYGKMDGRACKRAAEFIAELEWDENVEDNIPLVWPDSDKEYDTPGIWRQISSWTCECCHKVCHTNPEREMIKCPWCGISLARRLEGNQVVIRPTNRN